MGLSGAVVGLGGVARGCCDWIVVVFARPYCGRCLQSLSLSLSLSLPLSSSPLFLFCLFLLLFASTWSSGLMFFYPGHGSFVGESVLIAVVCEYHTRARAGAGVARHTRAQWRVFCLFVFF